MSLLSSLPLSRRALLGRSSWGLGALAWAWLSGEQSPQHAARGSEPLDSIQETTARHGGLPTLPHFAPRAKRVIFLHMSGGPSQIELFDPKPGLVEHQGEDLPESIRKGQRLTTMTADQKRKPLTPSAYRFARAGRCGMELSELLPHLAGVADELCLIRSAETDAINHDPGITFMQTGSEQPGRPSLGAWLSYGLGSECQNLPAFVVLLSGGREGQPLFGRLWGSGFLPSQHQGVKFRGGGDPVLYLSNPDGVDRELRRAMIDGVAELNAARLAAMGDPEIAARTAAYEMAFEMQDAVPRLADLRDERRATLDSYGPDVAMPGSFAWNCLMARRLVEQGVRVVQLYHRDWDHHDSLVSNIKAKCQQTDQPSAALLKDLKARGLLDETLVIWTGEFGRTAYCQGEVVDDFGRDHHGRCFSLWMAGGGVRRGFVLGETDEFSFNVVADPVHVHDLQATLLHLLGIDHTRFTFRFQGRDYRLTDVGGEVVQKILL